MIIQDSKAHLQALVAQRPDWEFDEHAVITQGWGSDVFKGRVAGQDVVFKYYKNPTGRLKEIWALGQLQGLPKIPRIIENIDPGPIVLTLMQGSLFDFKFNGADVPHGFETMTVMTEVAAFFADLNAHPYRSPETVSGNFTDDGLTLKWSTFDDHLAYIVARSREYLEKVPHWKLPPMLRALDIWEERLPHIAKEKRCLFYDDYNLTNIFVKDGHLNGVIDHENTREATVSAQLSTLLYSTIVHWPSRPALLQAYEDRAGQVDVEVWKNALALFQCQVWQRLACWGWEKNFGDPAVLAENMRKFEVEFRGQLEQRMKTGKWM